MPCPRPWGTGDLTSASLPTQTSHSILPPIAYTKPSDLGVRWTVHWSSHRATFPIQLCWELPSHGKGKELFHIHSAEIFSLCLTDPLGSQVVFLTQCFTFARGCIACLQPALSEMTRGFGGYYTEISQSPSRAWFFKSAGKIPQEIRFLKVPQIHNK